MHKEWPDDHLVVCTLCGRAYGWCCTSVDPSLSLLLDRKVQHLHLEGLETISKCFDGACLHMYTYT